MLVKIPPSEINEYGYLINRALMKAAPPFMVMTASKVENVTKSLRLGHATAWSIMFDDRLVGLCITKISEDRDLEIRSLILYCAYAMERLSEDKWDDCFNQMSEYAVSMGCTEMAGYTVVKRIMDMALRMGGNVDTVYFKIPVGVK